MPNSQGNRLQRSSKSGVSIVGNTNPSGTGMNGKCYYSGGINPALTCNKNEGNRVAIPVLTPDRATKRQNGRRFKEDGEDAFTLTGQDRHGVAVEVKEATKKGFAVARGGGMQSTTRCREAGQEEAESG